MNYGHLWGIRRTNVGFGLPYVAAHVKLLLFTLVNGIKDAAQQLWQRIDYPYTLCPLYTDQYQAYKGTLPQHLHWAKDKHSGATSHIERWNNTLRQRIARFVRKTLSFSKSQQMHHIMLEWFIINYNLKIALSLTA